MTVASFILFPFSGLYKIVTSVRNTFYDRGLIGSHQFEIPTICVGNLRVGGTGKTPFVELLITYFLSKNQQIGVLSRGYGRKTKGFISADKTSTSNDLGDESFQYFLKFGEKINVYVDEKRPHGISSIINAKPETQIIILDDAFQHRSLKSKINILLTEYSRPFYCDYLLPSGRLRESRNGASRADIIIVTKCPDINDAEAQKVKREIEIFSKKNCPVFFTKIVYGKPVGNVFQFENDLNSYILVCGIDNPIPFINHCIENYKISDQMVFNDHHDFNKEDIKQIKASKQPILTTQKDFMRLKIWEKELAGCKIFYIPITTAFLSAENEFWEVLDRGITS